MELLEVIKRRRSVRSFTEDPISSEHLKALLESAYNAPVGKAAYPRYELIVLKNRKGIEDLARLIKLTGSSLMDPFFNAPLVIFVTGEMSKERLNGCDTGCIIENIMLSATDLGLGSCFLYTISEIINAREELKSAVGIRQGYVAMSAVVIGHPKEKDLPLKVRPGIKTRVDE